MGLIAGLVILACGIPCIIKSRERVKDAKRALENAKQVYEKYQ